MSDETNTVRAAIVADLLRWTDAYYPDRAELPPNIAALQLSDAEVIELFALVRSRVAHLALVDLPVIRDRLVDPVLTDVARVAWRRNDPAAILPK